MGALKRYTTRRKPRPSSQAKMYPKSQGMRGVSIPRSKALQSVPYRNMATTRKVPVNGGFGPPRGGWDPLKKIPYGRRVMRSRPSQSI